MITHLAEETKWEETKVECERVATQSARNGSAEAGSGNTEKGDVPGSGKFEEPLLGTRSSEVTQEGRVVDSGLHRDAWISPSKWLLSAQAGRHKMQHPHPHPAVSTPSAVIPVISLHAVQTHSEGGKGFSPKDLGYQLGYLDNDGYPRRIIAFRPIVVPLPLPVPLPRPLLLPVPAPPIIVFLPAISSTSIPIVPSTTTAKSLRSSTRASTPPCTAPITLALATATATATATSQVSINSEQNIVVFRTFDSSYHPAESKVQDPPCFLLPVKSGNNTLQELSTVRITNISPAQAIISQYPKLPVLSLSTSKRGKESSTPTSADSIRKSKRESVQKQSATVVPMGTTGGDRLGGIRRPAKDKDREGERGGSYEREREKEREENKGRREVQRREDNWLKQNRFYPFIQYFPLLPLYDINATRAVPGSLIVMKESAADEGDELDISECNTVIGGHPTLKKKKKTFEQYTAELEDMQAKRNEDKERDEGISRNENNNKYYTVIPHDKDEDAVDSSNDSIVDVLNCNKNKIKNKRRRETERERERERESRTVCNSNGHLVCCDLR